MTTSLTIASRNRDVNTILRVTRQNPCPICGKGDWCGISADGKLAFCARIQSDQQAHNGAYIHRLDAQTITAPLSSPRPSSVKQLPLASAEARDSAYRALLAELSLSQPDSRNLLARGLTSGQIADLGYKSFPIEGRQTIAHNLAKRLPLAGVPGFWLDNGLIRLSGASGILIPVRDTAKCIVGIQVRCDQAEGGKYKWLSSSSKPDGCSSGAPVHVAGAVFTGGEVWITEGALKADIAASKLGRTVLAVAGVGNWRGVMPILQELKPYHVVVAYDMDKSSNNTVAAYERSLVVSLMGLGLDVYVADWPPQYKGLDDVLVGEVKRD